jgi:hypothetical protein
MSDETPIMNEPNDATVMTPYEGPRLMSLPRELGVLMVVAGIGGILLPGPVGTPFLLVGGVILCPKVFQRAEHAFERRFPRMHREGMRQINRFVLDLERRYPTR